MRFFTVMIVAISAMFVSMPGSELPIMSAQSLIASFHSQGGVTLAESIGFADTADAQSAGTTGGCYPIPYCSMSVTDVPGCKRGHAKIGGSCADLYKHPPPNHTYDLDSVEACNGYKYGIEKADNGWLWVYIWDGAGDIKGVGVFDSCNQADYTGRGCAAVNGGCHQVGS
jgi:hypothetical protein